MSLYNLLHGVNPFSPLLMSLVGVRMEEVPRFRDVFLFEVAPKEKGVAIHTRTGGGNRDYYESRESCRSNYPEYFDGTDKDPSGPWNDDLRAKSGFLRDEDDDFDSTYATFYFRVPAALQSTLQQIAGIGGSGEEPRAAWDRILTKLRELPTDSADEEMRNALEVGRPIVQAILDALASSHTESGS